MPELPEVEVVRRGLAEFVSGRTLVRTEVLHERASRRHVEGSIDLVAQLCGRAVVDVCRRGKYLWLRLDGDQAIVVHLGMSGQMIIQPSGAPDERHLRIRSVLDDGNELRFIDQRTFGGWQLSDVVTVNGVDHAGQLAAREVPVPVAHIALDPLDRHFNVESAVSGVKTKSTEIKRVLLDQTVISGIGNIYADEALWTSKLHGARNTQSLSRTQVRVVIDAARDVMARALEQGGTSFDSLYVNVNGESGYFERSLNAYGREGLPCRRCGASMAREKFMNRSSFFCPRCQPPPQP